MAHEWVNYPDGSKYCAKCGGVKTYAGEIKPGSLPLCEPPELLSTTKRVIDGVTVDGPIS